MEAFLVSTGIVTLAEIGDKTQLLAFLLAAQYRKPIPIIFGIFAATLINHGLAGAVGSWITALVSPNTLRWILGISFIAMAGWILVPDKLEENKTKLPKGGVFAATLITFFFAEIGDKTQIATVALAAQYPSFIAVVAGTTTGMMIANIPAVLLGNRIAHKLSTKLVHAVAAILFVTLGIITLTGSDRLLGL
jgi:putative Ca2+/H+ antiporter (TMEM165/GDT1 family)